MARLARQAARPALAAAFAAALLATIAAPAGADGTWQAAASLPTASYGLAGATAPCPGSGSRTCAYAFGGSSPTAPIGAAEAYSPATSTWTTLPSLPTARDDLAGAAAPCPRRVRGLRGTCVYAIGGLNVTNLSTVEAYSPATSTWAALPSLPTGTSSLAAATAPCPRHVSGLQGTCVYAIGGETNVTHVSTVDAYSPATNTWAAVASLPAPQYALAGATASCPRGVSGLEGTCVYAIGGYNSVGDATGTVLAYSPATNTWVTLPSLPTARYGLAATTAPCLRGVSGLEGTCIYAIGGVGSVNILATVEGYSPATNAWATVPSLPAPDYALATVTAPCPRALSRACAYAMGGNNTTGVLSTVDVLR